jgi:hypothetical protein
MRLFPARSRPGFALSGALLLLAPAGASAQQVFADANPCAIFGSGYVAVTGGEGCARIGERVRVDGGPGPRAVSASPAGALGYAPRATGSISPLPAGPAQTPAHVRAPGPAGAGADWPRTR